MQNGSIGFGKKKKAKFNNPYKVPNDDASAIRALDNVALVAKAALEYKNWIAATRVKKNDGLLVDLREQIKGLKDEIAKRPDIVEAAEKLKKMKEDAVSEEQAKLEEEAKNAASTHNEDVRSFKGVFQVAMDEIAQRKDSGAMK